MENGWSSKLSAASLKILHALVILKPSFACKFGEKQTGLEFGEKHLRMAEVLGRPFPKRAASSKTGEGVRCVISAILPKVFLS